MQQSQGLFRAKLSLIALGAAGVLSLSACAHSDGTAKAGGVELTAQSGVTPNFNGDLLAEAAFWGTRYDRDPADSEAALNYGRALRRVGKTGEAISVLQKGARLNRENVDLQFELGKSLVADGRSFEGVRQLEQSIVARPTDWELRSAFGVALDQIGQHREAREQYDAGLSLAPKNMILLNNKALSFALSGRLDDAEMILREVSGRSDASIRVRQNLALVLGLKGDFREAERLSRSDLPPMVAENNIAYYRSLLTQPAYWRDLQALDGNTAQTDRVQSNTPWEAIGDANWPADEPARGVTRPQPASAKPAPAGAPLKISPYN